MLGVWSSRRNQTGFENIGSIRRLSTQVVANFPYWVFGERERDQMPITFLIFFTLPVIHSLIRSLTHSAIHSFIHSSSQPTNQPFIHPSIHRVMRTKKEMPTRKVVVAAAEGESKLSACCCVVQVYYMYS
jgi:hypothetical protein